MTKLAAFLAALLFAVTLGMAQDNVVLQHKVAGGGTPDLINETFEGTGYSTPTCGSAPCGTWTEPGTGGTTDEDQSGSCPVGAGFSTQCLDTNTGSSGSNPFAALDSGSAHSAASYFSFFLDLASTGAWGAGQDQTIFTVDSASGTPSAFTAAVFIELLYYADATADPETPDCGAYPCVRMQVHIADGTPFTLKPEVTINAIHRMRIKIDDGAATSEVYLDSTLIGSGTDSGAQGHGAWRYVRIGQVETSKAAETFYWDNLKASSTSYAD